MKNCTDCKHAQWERTAAGKLHPSGDGLCKWELKPPVLPQSMYWLYTGPTQPCGGLINRRRELKDHCIYWSKT